MVFLARLTIWRFFFSLPIITWPAAKAAFYQGIAEGLRDPFDQEVNLREAFIRGFFDHLVRSMVIALINGLILVVIILSIVFWTFQEQFVLNLLAGIALPFLIYWWMCQPFIYPLLIEHPEMPVVQFAREIIRLVARHLTFSFVTAFSLTWLFLLSLPLLGPLSLITIPFLALITTQALWVVMGKTIPDLVDPVKYADFLAEKKREVQDDPETSSADN